MYCTRRISDDLIWVGGNDRRLAMFEGVYSVPDGVSYNSYLLLDQMTVLFDTVDRAVDRVFFENLEHALAGRSLDFVVVSHMEPDHSATLRELLLRYPDVIIVCNQKSHDMMKRFGYIGDDRKPYLVKEGDVMRTGKHEFTFVMAPMVHWPEVMMTFDKTTGTLFTADAFGCFGALNGNLFADEVDFFRDYLDEARRYYTNIVGKYGAQVQALLKKLSDLEIKKICPLHGPVLDENLEYYLNTYNTWSSYEPEDKGIFIAYCSLHGNTEEAAQKLAEILRQKGNVKVSIADLRRDDLHECVEDAFRYDRLVLAAPTYDAGVMPIMEDFIHHLSIKNYQKRRVAIIENGSWAPVAGKKMREAMEAMKQITIVEPIVTVESTVKADTIEKLQTLADALLAE